MTRFILKLSCILSLLGLPSCSALTPLPSGSGKQSAREELSERTASREMLAVLFVGNSYSFGAPKAFAKLAASRGRQVRVGHSTYGGWSLERHAANEGTLKKIRQGNWDVVVLQEQSEIPSWSSRKVAARMFPPLRQLVTEVRQHGAIPVLYQTWGRRDGDKKRKGDDFHAMTARLRSGYRAAAAICGGLVIIKVGDAWEKEYSEGAGRTLFMEDGSHPSPIGNALIAEVFYDTFYGK